MNQYPADKENLPTWSEFRPEGSENKIRSHISVIANFIEKVPGFVVKFAQNIMLLTSQRYSSQMSYEHDKGEVERELKDIIKNLKEELELYDYKIKFDLIEFEYKSVYLNAFGNKMACVATAAYNMDGNTEIIKEQVEQVKKDLNWDRLRKNKDYLKVYESSLDAWLTISSDKYLRSNAVPTYINEHLAGKIGINTGYYILTKEGNVWLNNNKLLRGTY